MTLERMTETGLSASERRHLGALEKRIAAGLQTFREVGAALLEIRDGRLYRETHSSFDAYCNERWAMNRVRAYQLIDSAKVVKVLGDPNDLTNEAQARELSSLTDEPEKAKQVWDAVERRAEEAKKPITATLIRQVKSEVLHNGNGTAELSPTERLLQDIARLGNSWQKWHGLKPSVGEKRRVTTALREFIELVT